MQAGDLVVCIDADGTKWPGCLVKGRIYTVLAYPCPNFGEKYIVIDCESPAKQNQWFARRFRPVSPNRIQVFRSMLINPRKRVEVEA